MTAQNVLAGRAPWSVDQGDCRTWLGSLPSDSVDLCVFSPPYEAARTYGIDFKLKGQAWVDFMVDVFRHCSRVCKGLIACVCEGQTRKFRWSATPILLAADLHRCGFHLRRPVIYHRVGIPGSGSKDWFRADTEYIVCVARPGKLPWSDNTAMGHPPKWAPGGEMSYREADGTRRNQWGMTGAIGGGSKNGRGKFTSEEPRPSHVFEGIEPEPEPKSGPNEWGGYGSTIGRKPDGSMANGVPGSTKGSTAYKLHTKAKANGDEDQVYFPPTKANPGNLVQESLTLPEFVGILALYANATKTNAGTVLQDVRRVIDSEVLPRWFRGVHHTILGASILLSDLHGEDSEDKAGLRFLSRMQAAIQSEPTWGNLLREAMLPDAPGPGCRSVEGIDNHGAYEPMPSQESKATSGVQQVRRKKKAVNSPHRREPVQQPSEQPGNPVQSLPHETSSSQGLLQGVRQASEGARLLREALGKVQETWRSIVEANIALARTQESSDIVHCKVGGGLMGHPLAHLNEAPYSISLCEFFIRSCCPPGGVVLDPFVGSGTSGHSAIEWGRRFIGCDIRESQVILSSKRLATVQPRLLMGAAP